MATEPKQQTSTPMGVGLFAILVFLVTISLYAVVTGMGGSSFTTGLAVTTGMLLVAYFFFLAIGKKRSEFALGTGPQGTVLFLAFGIVCFFFVTPWMKDQFNITVMPLQWTATGQYISGSMDAVWLLGLLLVTVTAMFLASGRGKRKRY